MRSRIKFGRLAAFSSALALAFLAGCSSDKNPVAPATNATPIEIRTDAATYGTAGGFTLESATITGKILRLKVSYSGGCRTHTFAAAAPPAFMSSYPAQLALFIRHDGGDDPCLAIVNETLTFDVSPAISLHGPGPFYLRIVVPGATEYPKVLVQGSLLPR
ncbi:MAG TPA: hypothetical protein VJW75_06620 [Candidatus Eisenbacteria bacterium]|nr:hypothetical protein [Candidatus Eisenbacteria bacterium]